MMKLKLFVWDGALEDYSKGVVFALAHTEEEALALIEARDHVAHSVLLRDGPKSRCVETPEAFVVWGGG